MKKIKLLESVQTTTEFVPNIHIWFPQSSCPWLGMKKKSTRVNIYG